MTYHGLEDKGRLGSSISRLFLDSGAFGLFRRHAHGGKDYSWFDGPEFVDYVDRYAAFVKKYSQAIDLYANVDVIGCPRRTFEVQSYLETRHKLKPLPTFHFPSDTKHLRAYLDRGYDYIGFGGLAGRWKGMNVGPWLDAAWSIVCPPSNKYLPTVRVHGFGVTSVSMMLKYPWYSVDSTSYKMGAAYTAIFVPHGRPGDYNYLKQPHFIYVGDEATPKMELKNHYRYNRDNRRVVDRWAAHVGLPLGTRDEDGNVVEKGLFNNLGIRIRNNLFYFSELARHMPAYPRPFRHPKGKGLFT